MICVSLGSLLTSPAAQQSHPVGKPKFLDPIFEAAPVRVAQVLTDDVKLQTGHFLVASESAIASISTWTPFTESSLPTKRIFLPPAPSAP